MTSHIKVVGPIAVALGTAVAVMVMALFAAAIGIDSASLSQQTALLNTGLTDRVDEMNHLLTTQLIWDDAVRHLDNQFDLPWARVNVGAYLTNTDSQDSVLVLGDRNQPLYAMRGGGDADPATVAAAAPTTALVAQVRAAETQRYARRPLDWARLTKSPIQSSAFARIDGQIAVVTATLVQPDWKASLVHAHAPIVITVKRLDEGIITSLGQRFMARDLHIVSGPRARVGIPLQDANGVLLGRLVWSPKTAGDSFLARTLPFLLIMTLLLAWGGLRLNRKAISATRDLIATERRATHMALHDFLTGLANRRLFSDRLAQAVEQAKRGKHKVAVLCLDLDRFKEINDTFGHQTGDELVQQVARALKATCRASDTLARLGGDEFAIVQPDGSAASAAALGHRIIAALQTPMTLEAGTVHVSCSIGIAVSESDEHTAMELMRQADMALFRAKAGGRNQFSFFEYEMDAALKLRRALETDLREALATGGLEMHYQPQVDGRGKIIGVEALARWNHPVRGAISPAVFVQIAEDSGLIGPLGLFTLRRAFQESARWRDLKVAINVSARQLSLPTFVEDVHALLRDVGVNAGRFELEITEGVLLKDNEQTYSTLRRLKEAGFSMALDDFGTGYSSLSYLRRYPIDKIKIDRSFISNLGVDAEAGEVVAAIIKLAQALDLGIIAEGVETSEQRNKLIEVGCPDVQGFLFSRPLTAEAMAALAGAPHRVLEELG